MIRVQDAWAHYGGGPTVLRGADLEVAPGTVTCLVGRNGSGKSTLLRCAKGRFPLDRGRVEVDDLDPAANPRWARAVSAMTGYVAQDPEDQLVASTVFDEVAFGPCNLGLSRVEVTSRTERALEAARLTGRAHAPVSTLSGGQAQRLAVAGVLAMDPSYLLLDEVSAHLDEGSRRDLETVLSHCTRRGMGQAWATHRPEEVLAADVVVLVEDGGTPWRGTVDGFVADSSLWERAGMGERRLLHYARSLQDSGFDPRLVLDAGAAARILGRGPANTSPKTLRPAEGPGLEAKGVSVSLGGAEVLHGADLVVPRGRVVLVVGPSGSGKTTLARVCAGLVEPDGGTVSLAGAPVRPGAVGLCFQRPEDQFFCDTVLEDVAFGPSQPPFQRSGARERAEKALTAAQVDPRLWDRHPSELSGGERRLAAVAAVVARPCDAYVFDEPTAGLDGPARRALRSLVGRLAASGAAVAVVSHEVEEWSAVADSMAVVDDGRTLWQGPCGTVEAYGALARASMPPSATVALEAALQGAAS